jgi:uncharacterized membrane protein
MNGTQPKIEIFTPFGVAFEWMKSILFRPFDLSKWLTIAFAAFISGAWGGGFNPVRLFSGDWKTRTTSHGNLPTDWSMPAWGIGLIVLVVLAIVVLAFVFMWVGARGRFIFTDCVVKNRAAIAEPWREYRREGNSFFLFCLVLTLAVVVITALLVLAIVVPFGLLSDHKEAATTFGVAAVICAIFFGLIWLVLAVFVGVVSQFMIPVMYRRRCSAKEAFFDVSKLIFRNLGPFILFGLFGIVLALAVAMVGTLIACLTCCIGGLPYVSTVLLLPAIVWLAAFKLLFIRQFGDGYDVWATLGFMQPAAVAPPEPPPPNELLPPPPPPAPPAS